MTNVYKLSKKSVATSAVTANKQTHKQTNKQTNKQTIKQAPFTTNVYKLSKKPLFDNECKLFSWQQIFKNSFNII